MTTHYNISRAQTRAVQLQLQVIPIGAKQENDALGKGKR